MPIYDYICEGCGEKSELLVSSSSAVVRCPVCGSKKLKRQFSTFAAHKGGSSTPPCAGACSSAGDCCNRCPMSG